MALIFVYGTLKRGQSNHRFLRGQRLVGQGSTRPVYRLYLLDGYPGMVEAPLPGVAVEGEIWDVDATALAEIDRLEGTVEGLYARVAVALTPPWEGPGVETYLYRRGVDGRPDLGSRYEG